MVFIGIFQFVPLLSGLVEVNWRVMIGGFYAIQLTIVRLSMDDPKGESWS